MAREVHMVNKANQESKGPPGLQVQQDLRDLPVHQDPLVHQEQMVSPGKTERKDRLVLLVLKEMLAHRELRVHRDLPLQPALLGHQERQAHLAVQELLVVKEIQD